MTGKRRRVSAVDVLIAINAAIFVCQWLRPDLTDHLQDLYALNAAGMEEGRWWQLITYAFLHANIWHLLFNMIALWFAGRIVERVMGTGRFVALYAASAVAGGLAQLLLEGGTIPLLGASGAVFGVILAFTTMFPRSADRGASFFRHSLEIPCKVSGLGFGGILASVSSIRIRAMDRTRGAPWRMRGRISSCAA